MQRLSRNASRSTQVLKGVGVKDGVRALHQHVDRVSQWVLASDTALGVRVYLHDRDMCGRDGPESKLKGNELCAHRMLCTRGQHANFGVACGAAPAGLISSVG